MVHDFHEIVTFAKNVPKFGRSIQSLLILSQSQSGLDLATGAASGRNKPFSKLGQKFAVHAWLEIVTRKIRLRGESKQVLHGVIVCGPHGQVAVCSSSRDIVSPSVAPANSSLVFSATWRQVSLDANNRVYVVGFGLLPKLISAVVISVVGNSDGWHFKFGGLCYKLLYPGRPIEHGIFGVIMQVDE